MRARAWGTTIAVAAVLGATVVSVPVRSSEMPTPPRLPSFANDYLNAPVGATRTRLPRAVGVQGSTSFKAGVYDVHILVASTDDGAYPWDEAEARRQVEAMDAWYADQTKGGFRFRFAGFKILPSYPGRLCGVQDAQAHAKPEIDALRPTAGATDVLPVVVAVWPNNCEYAGQAWRGMPVAWVSVDRQYPSTASATLWHEIGHNLGLGHAAAIVLGNPADPWPTGAKPEIAEYGDAADMMGWGGQWACTWETCTFNTSGLHAHHRNLLRPLSPEEITYVPMASGTSDGTLIELVDDESGAAGYQVAYLPWRNTSKFFIEFRGAVGRDSHIGDEYGPGSGVQVRLVGSDTDTSPIPYPLQDYGKGSVAFPVAGPPAEGWNTQLGFKAGQGTLLPDGTRVEVVSILPDRASVRVTRPADLTAPTMSTPRIEYANGACTRYPCTLPATAAKAGKYRLFLALGSFDDDQWVASLSAKVNGSEVTADVRPTPDGTDEDTVFSPGARNWGVWKTYGPGTYSIEYTYRDLAGNTGTSTYRIILPKPKKR